MFLPFNKALIRSPIKIPELPVESDPNETLNKHFGSGRCT